MNTEKRDLSINMGRASAAGLALGVGAVLPFTWLYSQLHGSGSVVAAINLLLASWWQFILVLAGGIVVHELLHGITWSLAGGVAHSKMKYGVIWRALTPYCHSTVPLQATAYRWGTFMPALALGFAPMIVGLFTGAGWLFAFGVVMTAAAGGDFTILWLLRHISGDALVEDHPSRAGCYVYEMA